MLTPRCEWRDNTVGLHIALEKATLEEAQPVLPRLSATLAGPEHLGLRVAFAEWLRRSWAEEYGVLADLDDKSRRELDRSHHLQFSPYL